MIICEVCGEEFLTTHKLLLDNEIFICCSDCKVWIDDMNAANLIGLSLKDVIDKAIEKKKNDLH